MASSENYPTPTLMIAWTGDMQSKNFGAWVIENPTPTQLHVFKEASFPLQQACFAPPDLMAKAGARFYPNRRDCVAISKWLSSRPPPLLIGLEKRRGVEVWVLRNPTASQLNHFHEAGFPIFDRPLTADPTIMEKAGAKLHADLNVVPEVVSVLFAPLTKAELKGRNIFGWPLSGGVWALLNPTQQQREALERGGYDFRNYDGRDRFHGLLQEVGAKFYVNPESIKEEIEKVSPNFELGVQGQRGGKAE